MLNEERVKLMTKLASYESAEGKEDFKTSSYYRKDYTSMHTLITVIWTTIGYILIIGFVGVLMMDKIMNHLTIKMAFILGITAVATYIVLIIVFVIIANSFYHERYNNAKQRVKKYYRNLAHLNKMYEKEK